MPVIVEAPDGVEVEFPDGMTEEEMQAAMEGQFGQVTPQPRAVEGPSISAGEPPSLLQRFRQTGLAKELGLEAEGARLLRESQTLSSPDIASAGGPGIIPALSRPTIPMDVIKGDIDPSAPVMEKVPRALWNTVVGLAEFGTSPLGVGTMGLGALAQIPKNVLKLAEGSKYAQEGIAAADIASAARNLQTIKNAQRVVSGGYAAQMGAAVPESAREIGAASAEPGRLPESIVNLAVTTMLPEVAGIHAIKSGPNAAKIESTFNRALRERERTDASRFQKATEVHGDLRQLRQSASDVSPEVSREGVQSRSEAATQEGQERVLLTPEEWGRDVAPVLDEVSDANVVVGKTRRGAISEFDPTTGDVVLSDTEFANWLRGVEPSKRRAAVRATIAEEVNHRKFKEATTAEERAAYWENLSAPEKAFHRRAYIGEWGTSKAAGRFREVTGRELTPELLGYEAANARQMRLARMTRREVLEAVGKEKWTVQSVDALANMLFKTREALGTKASKEQIAILDRIESNLAVARTAVAAPQSGDVAKEDQPFAFNKDRERFTPVLETKSGKHYPGATHTDALKRATQDMKDGKITADEFFDILEASEADAQHKFRAADGTILTRDQLAERTGGLRQSEQLRDAGLIASPEGAPAAFNKQRPEAEITKQLDKIMPDWRGSFGSDWSHLPVNVQKLFHELAGLDWEKMKGEPIISESNYYDEKLGVWAPETTKKAAPAELKDDFLKRWADGTFKEINNQLDEYHEAVELTDPQKQKDVAANVEHLAKVYEEITKQSPFDQDGALNEQGHRAIMGIKEETPGGEEQSFPAAFRKNRPSDEFPEDKPEPVNRMFQKQEEIVSKIDKYGMLIDGERQRQVDFLSEDPADAIQNVAAMILSVGREEARRYILKAFEGAYPSQDAMNRASLAAWYDLKNKKIEIVGHDKYTEGADETSFPAAFRKKTKDTSEQQFMFLPPVSKQTELERPGTEATKAVEPTREEKLAPKQEITPTSVSGLASSIIGEQQTRRAFTKEKIPKDVVLPPTFKLFAEQAKEKFGSNLDEAQLRGVWEDAINHHIETASGEELQRLRSTLHLQRLGTRPIAEPFDPTSPAAMEEGAHSEVTRVADNKMNLAQRLRIEAKRLDQIGVVAGKVPTAQRNLGEEFESPKSTLLKERADRLEEEAKQMRQFSTGGFKSKARLSPEMRRAQNYRNTIKRAIRDKLLTGAPKERLPSQILHRADISPEDVGWEVPSKYGAWRELSGDEARRPEILAKIIGDAARVKTEDVSATRRLLVMANPETGAVHLVSAYPHGREGALAVNPLKAMRAMKGSLDNPIPEGARVNDSLENVMKLYRPFETILLNEPVKNFYRRFASVAEYNDALGSKLRTETEAQASLETSSGGRMRRRIGGEEEYGEGFADVFSPEAEGPSTMDAWNQMRKAKLQPDESGRLLDHLMDETGGKVTSADDIRQNLQEAAEAKNWDVLPAYQKIFDALRRQHKDVAPDKVYDEILPEEIWKRVRAAQSRDQFIRDAMEGFEGESLQAVRPVEEVAETGRQVTVREREVPVIGVPEFTRRFSKPYPFEPGSAQPMRLKEHGGVLKQKMEPEPGVKRTGPKLYLPGHGGVLFREGEKAAPGVPARTGVPAAGEGTTEGGPAAFRKPLSQEEATALAKERFGPRGFAHELKTAEGETFGYRVGYARTGKTGRGLTTTKGRSQTGFQEAFEDADESSPAAFRKPPTTKKEFLKNLLTTPGAGFSRWYSEWMSEAVRSQGGAQSSRAADTADAITDRAKSLYGFELTPTLDKAKELAGGAPRRGVLGQIPSPRLIRANAWLDKLNHPASGRTGVANVVDAIEGRAVIPAAARATVDAAKAADAEAMKLVAAVVPGWKGKGAFQRNMTPLGFDILSEGPTSKSPSDLWNIYTRDTAILNHRILNARRVAAKEPAISVGEEIRQSRRFFLNMRDAFRDNADANRIEKINQDFARLYPKALTHIKTASGWQEMMHTSLFNYLENVAQRAAHTRAFREQFPLNAAGKLDFAQLDAGVRSELPATSIPYWDALVKTMQGRPTDSYAKAGPLRPGQPWGEMIKGLNQTVMSTAKRLALTGQMVTQLPETALGSGVAELGMMNRLRSLVKLKQLWPEMEKQGQVNQLLYDWSYDPKNPVRSLFRQGNNLLSKVFAENFLNEFQGRLGAAIAKSAADRIRNQAAEPLTSWEKRQYPETFRKMQFTPDQVSALMAGDGALLNVFERRAPAWLTTENRAKTETSLAGNNRLLNSVFPFQMYPMNKLNQFRRNYQRMGEAWRSGDKKQMVAAGEGLARFLFSTSAQGAAYALLASYAFGGKEGLKIKANEAADEPFEFLAESVMAAIGGPYYLLWRGARRNGVAGIGEQATRSLFPYAQAADVNDALQGNGQYRDQDISQRIGRFLQQKTPGLRIGKQALAIFGLGQESGPTEQAIKGFYRWKLDTYGPDQTRFDSPEDRKVFRSHMRRAVEAIKSGDGEAYDEAIFGAKQEAVKRTSVAQSFRARMLLKNPSGEDLTDEELDAVSNRIGEDALQRLQDYDAMLEQAAKGWTPSSLQ